MAAETLLGQINSNVPGPTLFDWVKEVAANSLGQMSEAGYVREFVRRDREQQWEAQQSRNVSNHARVEIKLLVDLLKWQMSRLITWATRYQTSSAT